MKIVVITSGDKLGKICPVRSMLQVFVQSLPQVPLTVLPFGVPRALTQKAVFYLLDGVRII